MAQSDDDLLTQAIDRNAAAVLALPSAGMTRYHKSRFLRGEDQRIWLESVPTEQPLITSLIQTQEPVTVSFKTGQRTANFASAIFELDCLYRFFDSQALVHAVLMHRPAVVKPVQRRTHFRVPVRESDQFSIKLWRIAEHADLKDDPPELGFLPAVVRDLSVGGVGVIFPDKPVLISNQRLRVLLQPGPSPVPIMLLEGRSGQVRNIKDSPMYETGVQFQGLQASLQGRQMLTDLTRIVSMLQLQEARRLKMMGK